jgi:hypothetical protein
MEELISKQAAIDAICWICGRDCDKSKFVYNAPQYEQVILCPEHYALSTLLPAKPEPLTDKEQRIFLAAMEREEKVCEEVDRNYVREPYEDSLVQVCKEIRRKVKGALWIQSTDEL